jgi:hypothetical protein
MGTMNLSDNERWIIGRLVELAANLEEQAGAVTDGEATKRAIKRLEETAPPDSIGLFLSALKP